MFFLQKATLLTTFLATPFLVDGHGYLASPRARNHHARVAGVDFGGDSSTPKKEYCEHCLNRGGTLAVCGLIEDRNYDFPPNSVGGTMPNIIQASYSAGSTIEFESILTAHHWGHFTLKACPISPGQVPSQSCFDANPLEFVEDTLYGAPRDPNFPERAYIPGTDVTVKTPEEHHLFRHRFKLPSGVSGNLVMLQWHYTTANSCKPVGYDAYSWPNLNPIRNLGTCTSIPPDGNGVPEQFWNCAEVSIGGGGPPSPTPPTPTPPTGSGTCGNGSRGDGVCAGGECCSQFGWCGTSSDHCSGNPPPSPTPPAPTPPAPASPAPTPHAPTPGTCAGCSWDNGANCPDQWCNLSKDNCNVHCNGSWFGGGTGGACGGCSWDNGANCPDQWCNQSQANCVNQCSGSWFGGGSIPSPTPPPGGTCGNGNRGNGVCANGECCSQYGWCGKSSAHCELPHKMMVMGSGLDRNSSGFGE